MEMSSRWRFVMMYILSQWVTFAPAKHPRISRLRVFSLDMSWESIFTQKVKFCLLVTKYCFKFYQIHNIVIWCKDTKNIPYCTYSEDLYITDCPYLEILQCSFTGAYLLKHYKSVLNTDREGFFLRFASKALRDYEPEGSHPSL